MFIKCCLCFCSVWHAGSDPEHHGESNSAWGDTFKRLAWGDTFKRLVSLKILNEAIKISRLLQEVTIYKHLAFVPEKGLNNESVVKIVATNCPSFSEIKVWNSVQQSTLCQCCWPADGSNVDDSFSLLRNVGYGEEGVCLFHQLSFQYKGRMNPGTFSSVPVA